MRSRGGFGLSYCLHPIEQCKSCGRDLCEVHVRSQWAGQRDRCCHEVARGVDAGHVGEVVADVLIRGGNGLYRGGIG